MELRRAFLFLLAALFSSSFTQWGFYGHRLITEMAIYTLPSTLNSFYKNHAEIIIARSVVPDQRRYVIPEEGPRHYIDLDLYENRDFANQMHTKSNVVTFLLLPAASSSRSPPGLSLSSPKGNLLLAYADLCVSSTT